MGHLEGFSIEYVCVYVSVCGRVFTMGDENIT